MTALLERLEGAREGSRELDLWIEGASYGGIGRLVGTTRDVPAYTTSIDAALALAERVLGGARWIITQQVTGWGVMPLVKTDGVWDSPNDPGETYGATLPLAIVAALIRATAKEEAGG